MGILPHLGQLNILDADPLKENGYQHEPVKGSDAIYSKTIH